MTKKDQRRKPVGGVEGGGGGWGTAWKLVRQRWKQSINTLVNEIRLFTTRWASRITGCAQDADYGWQLKKNHVHRLRKRHTHTHTFELMHQL